MHTITQLTDNTSFESQHTYYDICPWSFDGRFIVYSSAPTDSEWVPFAHDGLACREKRVSVLDTETRKHREIASGATYLKHGGAFCLWHPSKHRVYYSKTEDALGCVDISSGEERVINTRVRQLSPDGTEFTTFLRSPHGGGQGEAIGIVGEDGTGGRELVNREQLYYLTPNSNEFRPEDMLLGNTKWRPDGQYILVAMWSDLRQMRLSGLLTSQRYSRAATMEHTPTLFGIRTVQSLFITPLRAGIVKSTMS